eukprot:gene10898-biopygen8387
MWGCVGWCGAHNTTGTYRNCLDDVCSKRCELPHASVRPFPKHCLRSRDGEYHWEFPFGDLNQATYDESNELRQQQGGVSSLSSETVQAELSKRTPSAVETSRFRETAPERQALHYCHIEDQDAEGNLSLSGQRHTGRSGK